jgi:hypothetical protein
MNKDKKNLKEFDAATARWLNGKRVELEAHLAYMNAKLDRQEAETKRRVAAIKAATRHGADRLKKVELDYDDDAPIAPPQLAKFIIYVLIPRNNREAILGDLEEEFYETHKEFGLLKAKINYCVQVLRSIWPIVGGIITKLVISSIKRLMAS